MLGFAIMYKLLVFNVHFLAPRIGPTSFLSKFGWLQVWLSLQFLPVCTFTWNAKLRLAVPNLANNSKLISYISKDNHTCIHLNSYHSYLFCEVRLVLLCDSCLHWKCYLFPYLQKICWLVHFSHRCSSITHSYFTFWLAHPEIEPYRLRIICFN